MKKVLISLAIMFGFSQLALADDQCYAVGLVETEVYSSCDFCLKVTPNTKGSAKADGVDLKQEIALTTTDVREIHVEQFFKGDFDISNVPGYANQVAFSSTDATVGSFAELPNVDCGKITKFFRGDKSKSPAVAVNIFIGNKDQIGSVN